MGKNINCIIERLRHLQQDSLEMEDGEVQAWFCVASKELDVS